MSPGGVISGRAARRARAGRTASSGSSPVSVAAFVRVSTNRRVLDEPLNVADAAAELRQWTGRRKVWMPEPGARFASVCPQLLEDLQASGNLATDAYLAALAVEHGLTVVSSDAGFARFAQVKWCNPLT